MTDIVRTATCTCGALRITVRGEPEQVHACSCRDCQRSSGSAFSYTAFFPSPAVVGVEGEYRSWRRVADSGFYDESCFCPTCGGAVFGWMEALPGITKVSAGCFNDPGFPTPGRLCWASRKQDWLTLPAGIEELVTQ